ncbi:MAG TPA: hypothetical protein DGR97_12060 [Gammaproteobacteria bacterium]|nr:hypothetical protein [Gammaproteobacteria bacterium]
MIVQTAEEGREHFVITMDQHTALSAQFAEHFGNDEFESVKPREQMLHIIANHDIGWRELDASALRDPATGLPYNLVQTPFEQIVATSKLSPDRNGNTHAYCELMSSMHSWGLYNGRYGMSEKMLLDSLAAENRATADTMLDKEKARQDQLKATLKEDSETAEWIEDEHLFQNYKQLQFFDTFALYFNCVQESERQEACFSHIPMSATKDTNVEIKPLGGGEYSMNPFPFDVDGVEMTFEGRLLAPVDEGDNVREQLNAVPVTTQTFRLVAA